MRFVAEMHSSTVDSCGCGNSTPSGRAALRLQQAARRAANRVSDLRVSITGDRYQPRTSSDSQSMPAGIDDGSPEVANTLENAVVHGNVLQTGSVTGDIHLHPPDRRPVTLPHRAGLVPPRATAFQNRRMIDRPTLQSNTGTNELTGPGDSGVWVLSGLGGVGKTQLMVDLAETAWAAREIDLLLWISATSREAVVVSYGGLAVDLTGVDDGTPAQNAIRLLEWLAATPARWLVALDDLQNPGDLRGLWPPLTATGITVVTTRRRDAALRGYQRELVDLGAFTPTESVTYLRTTLAEHPHLLDDTDGVASDLGFLPLALAQAAAYMLDRSLTCAAYRQRWIDRRRHLTSLLPTGDELPDGHQTTVATTWSLSIEQANRLEPRGLAAPLLELASLLDPNGIPAAVFETPATLTWLDSLSTQDLSKDDVADGLARPAPHEPDHRRSDRACPRRACPRPGATRDSRQPRRRTPRTFGAHCCGCAVGRVARHRHRHVAGSSAPISHRHPVPPHAWCPLAAPGAPCPLPNSKIL